VKAMCEVLEVSTSGYYAWRNRHTSLRQRSDATLLTQIQEEYRKSRRNYGSPRIYRVLKSQGMCIGRKRVARVMRQNAIVAEPYRRIKWKRCFKTAKAAGNFVQRQFSVPALNRIWAADMTCFWTGSGWVHLAVAMDLCSRRIVGWAMHSQMTERLVVDVLEMAVLSRRPTGPLIHHSDQGSQYQSQSFRSKLQENGITLSMSRRGNC